MQRVIVGMIVVFMLAACGSPSPGLDATPGPLEDGAMDEGMASAEPISFDPPPPILGGRFTQTMPISINEVLFEENEAGDFSVLGMLEIDSLLYIYLHDRSEIYYAVSSNGSDWALSPEPIFTGMINSDFQYRPLSVQALHQRYAIFLESDTINYADNNFLYSIWNLTALEPTGPWTLGEVPVLYSYPNPAGFTLYVAHPIVRPYLEGFRMYYAYSFQIEGIRTPEYAVAHSWDGLFWRYVQDLPVPDLPDEVVPIGFPSEEDMAGWHMLDVWPTQAGWQMLYRADDSDTGLAQIYLAESENGLEWMPSAIGIHLPVEIPPEDLVSASVLYFEGQYLLSCCIETGPHLTQCYLTANESETE